MVSIARCFVVMVVGFVMMGFVVTVTDLATVMVMVTCDTFCCFLETIGQSATDILGNGKH